MRIINYSDGKVYNILKTCFIRPNNLLNGSERVDPGGRKGSLPEKVLRR